MQGTGIEVVRNLLDAEIEKHKKVLVVAEGLRDLFDIGRLVVAHDAPV